MIFIRENKILKIVFVFLILITFVSPTFVVAQETEATARQIESEGLVHCGGEGEPACRFSDLFVLINRLVTFMLFVLALPLATISIAVAGWKMIVSGDNSGEREEAKEILRYVAIGLILAFAAWLIIDTIVDALVDTEQVFESPTNER